jgi:uncharacterized protein (TIGR00251 family)
LIKLTPHSAGFLLSLKVVPGSSRDRIAGVYGDGIKITVRKAPEAGKANRAVIELLASQLQIPAANLTILRGLTNPKKQILITSLPADEIHRRLTLP